MDAVYGQDCFENGAGGSFLVTAPGVGAWFAVTRKLPAYSTGSALQHTRDLSKAVVLLFIAGDRHIAFACYFWGSCASADLNGSGVALQIWIRQLQMPGACQKVGI